MKFERGLDPKHAMGIGRFKDSTEIEGIRIKALARVYEEDRHWTGRDWGNNQIGQALIEFDPVSEMIHHLFEQMVLGWNIKPILDNWVYWEFKRQQIDEKKYTSAPVRKDDMKIIYNPIMESRHSDVGVYLYSLKSKDKLWDRLHYMSGNEILFEEKFYQIPEDLLNDEF